jgi:TP901 family phage tail tape measure protein
VARVFQTDVILRLIDRLTGPLGAAAKKIERSNLGIARSFNTLNRFSGRMAFGMAGITTGLVAAERLFTKMREISKLQNELAAASVRAEGGLAKGITGKESKDNVDAAIDISRRYNLSVTDTLKSMAALTRAGNNPAMVQAASVWPAMLAKIGKMDTEEAADMMSQLATVFKMPRGTQEQANQTFQTIGNILGAFETAAPGKIRDVAMSLKFSAGIMAQAGFTLKESVGIFTALAQAGLKGEKAGTFVRSTMVSLLRRKKSALDIMAAQGMKTNEFVKQVPTTGKSLAEEFAASFATRGSEDEDWNVPDLSKHIPKLDKMLKIKDAKIRHAEMMKWVKQVAPGDVLARGSEELARLVNENFAKAGTQIDFMKFLMAALEKFKLEDIPKLIEGRQTSNLQVAADQALNAIAKMNAETPGDMLIKQYEALTQGLDGAVTKLGNAFERLAGVLSTSVIGESLTSGITSLAKAIDSLAISIADLDKANPALLKTIGAITALAALGGGAILLRSLGKGILGLGKIAAGASLAAAGAGATAGTAGATPGAGKGPQQAPSLGSRFNAKNLLKGGIIGSAIAVTGEWLIDKTLMEWGPALAASIKTGVAQKKLDLPDKASGGKLFDQATARANMKNIGVGGGKPTASPTWMQNAADAAQELAAGSSEAHRKQMELISTQAAVQTWGSVVRGTMQEITGGVAGAAGSFGGLINKINETGTAIQNLQQKSQGLGAAIRAASAAGAAASSAVGAAAASASRARLDVNIKTDANANVASVRGSGALANTRIATKYRGRIMDEIATA